MPRNIQGSKDQRLSQRVELLAQTDWLTIRNRDQVEHGVTPTLSPEQYAELLTYRQALRDWPGTGDFNEPYPIAPGFI